MPRFKDLSLEKRQCRFPDEVTGKSRLGVNDQLSYNLHFYTDPNHGFFTKYTQKACAFECMMNRTDLVGSPICICFRKKISVPFQPCLPWDYVDFRKDLPLCTRYTGPETNVSSLDKVRHMLR